MKKKHHHGDLREALINAGIELLNESDISALTLRKCAAKAGVSHAAPAHHFAGLPGLKSAIAARGTDKLAQTMQHEIDNTEDQPYKRLEAMCNGYLMFALANPALTNLMFNLQNVCLESTHSGRSNSSAYKILVDCCAPFKQQNTPSQVTQLAVWSMIHGYSQLALLGQIDPHNQHINFADLLAQLHLQLEETP